MNTLSSLTSAQLKRAGEIQEQIESLNGQLTSLLDGNKFMPPSKAAAKIKASTGVATTMPKKKKRKMSAAARAKIGAAQKARWAKFHAEK